MSGDHRVVIVRIYLSLACLEGLLALALLLSLPGSGAADRLLGLSPGRLILLALPRFSDIRVLELPQNTLVRSSLDNLRQNIDRYKQEGEILFLDQRQLLTFGFVQNLPLVPEYEKKYLMDQAMAGNAAYFREFFDDLANKRFALIVSEPLFRSYDDEYVPFSEENNAWVKWVSKTVLCFYTPEKTYREVRVQLLVPRAGSLDCELPQP